MLDVSRGLFWNLTGACEMLLGKGIPWQNFLDLCVKFWFLSNPKEDGMKSSLCLCFDPNGSEYLLIQ